MAVWDLPVEDLSGAPDNLDMRDEMLASIAISLKRIADVMTSRYIAPVDPDFAEVPETVAPPPFVPAKVGEMCQRCFLIVRDGRKHGPQPNGCDESPF